ncbi:DUF2867 domain-containing protein [Niveibacterium sp. SC-1]|uniref:DUF2867 domain-containing protein n=1 Tax=Niveibacterium sp. SC-1 TaxID=3135646 RepID=UPI00311FCDC6
MSDRPREIPMPLTGMIAALREGADFCDAWSVDSDAVDLSAMDLYIAAVKKTPRWVDACMNLRNRVVARLGLKDLGSLTTVPDAEAADRYRCGDRVGIFTLLENSFDEVLLGDKDKHLDVVLSVQRHAYPDGARIAVTVATVVHVHNLLGHLYMLPVKPMHRRIVPAVLRAIGPPPRTA